MKPTYAGIAATAAVASTLTLAFQEGAKGNATEPAAGQLTSAQIETELKAMNVFNKVEKDQDGTDVFDLTLDGVNVQLYAIPNSAGTPTYWRMSAGWDLAAAPRPDDVNRFNISSRQAFSYLDNEYDPFLVLDQNIASGSSTDMLRSVVSSYRDALPAFKATVLRNRA